MTATTKATPDIFDALYGVRVAFRAANLEPPQAIILASHDDGMRFLSAINATGMLAYRAGGPDAHARPVEHPDGSIWMQATFAGMSIRWPANRYATENGYVYG